MQQTNSAPIGVFDSGLGGLCAVRGLMELLPGEDVVYFGDTARVPYGSRSEETIKRYALQIMKFLSGKNIKAALVACGTMSTVAIGEIEAAGGGIPVVGVVEPSCRAAAETARSSGSAGIVVLGTAATIGSGVYQKRIAALDPGLKVTGKACPLFVPIVENGHTSADDPVASACAAHYLDEFKNAGQLTLLLGCTHYPMLAGVIKAKLPDAAPVDSGYCGGAELARLLGQSGLLNGRAAGGSLTVYVSDAPRGFAEAASRFLRFDVGDRTEKVDIDEY